MMEREEVWVWVMGEWWQVRFDRDELLDAHGSLGYLDNDRREILILSTINPVRASVVLVHELLHILDELLIPEDRIKHGQVMAAAPLLAGFFRDNGEVWRRLVGGELTGRKNEHG